MFVTEMLQGKPYQCFVPKPVLPAFDKTLIDAFKLVDIKLKHCPSSPSFDQACIATVCRVGGSGNLVTEIPAALSLAFSYNSIRKKQLLKINGLITQSTAISYRQKPSWLGSSHPAESWHVGSPVSKIEVLMEDVLGIEKSHLPISLSILVSMIRMLQIHPFSDGNGRTTRLYHCWRIKKMLGDKTAFLEVVDSLWQRNRFDLHGASLQIRDQDDWQPYLQHCLHRFNEVLVTV
jgi:Fic/DOC family